MVDLIKLNLKGKTKCDCGYEFSASDVKEITVNNDVHFYGGAVTHYSETECSKCHKKIVLLLATCDNSYKIIDIGEDTLQNGAKSEENIQVYEEFAQKDKEIENKKVICEKCGREFKSTAGLSSHKKKCLGNI